MTEPAEIGQDRRIATLFDDPALAQRLARHATSRAIALELSALRRESGLGVRELARAAGWDPAFVVRLEAGRGTIPTPASLLRFARACGAEVGYVFRARSGERSVAFGPDVLDTPADRDDPGGAPDQGGKIRPLPARLRERRAAAARNA
jgi:transcriptional regulator with XRE-family HTH domain